jgi:SAM-dependent methyltransferase
MTYALRLSPEERARYTAMAETARASEAAEWAIAGIGPGARVADVGCGPGAILRVLAETVGPDGRADGVDGDAGAVAAAEQEIVGLPQASVRVGLATESGLEPGSYDAVVCRHVLAHNGGKEAAIVAHLASLARSGGAVLLVDVNLPLVRRYPDDPDIADIQQRYEQFQGVRGNDLTVGLKLGSLLEQAGLVVEAFRAGGPVLRVPPGLRGPSWAAREAMVAAGLADDNDITRWAAAFERSDQLTDRPWMSITALVAVGRVPVSPPAG